MKYIIYETSMNNHQILRKLIKEILDSWEPESSYTQRIDAMAPAEVALILKNAIGGRHASGKRYHSAFLKSGMNENSEVWPSPEEIEKFLKDYKENFEVTPARNMYKDNYGDEDWKNLPHVVQQIIGSIFLFTGGHVPTVRDPNKYNQRRAHHPVMSHKYSLPADGSPASGAGGATKFPSFANYKMANHVMTILSSRKSETPVKAYRGIKVPNDPAFLEGLKPGVEFNCWPISSFTLNYSVAVDFASGPYGKLTDEGEWDNSECGILIKINKLITGTHIDPYSWFPNEFEFVSSPKLIIKNFIMRENGGHILSCEEI
jgi:hypothetical protein